MPVENTLVLDGTKRRAKSALSRIEKTRFKNQPKTKHEITRHRLPALLSLFR